MSLQKAINNLHYIIQIYVYNQFMVNVLSTNSWNAKQQSFYNKKSYVRSVNETIFI
jgi:hypothetical protein